MANQLAQALPLCARYTIAAAAEAPAVRSASAACKFVNVNQRYILHCNIQSFANRVDEQQDDPAALGTAPHNVEDGKRQGKNKVSTNK